MHNKITPEITDVIVAVATSIIGALMFKLYKMHNGEKFHRVKRFAHVAISALLGWILYPLIPEGRWSGPLLCIIGALSIQIMERTEKNGMEKLERFIRGK